MFRGLGGFAGVVRDGGGIGAHLVLDDLHADAIRPDRELIDGRGAEGVAGADHHLLVHLVLQQPGELGDAGGLARAVDAGDEDDRRPGRREFQLALFGAPQPASSSSRTIASASSAFLIFPSRQRSRTSPTMLDHVLHAHVGADELLFHLGQKRIVDLPPGDEERAHVGVEHLPRSS